MAMDQEGSQILIYTRRPNNDYTEALANSIHFAYSEGDHKFHPLNQNYGILFALAKVDEQDVIQEKGLKNPYLFRTKSGEFGITAVRVDKQGNEEETKGKVLFWSSKDLIDFHDWGLVELNDDFPEADIVAHVKSIEETANFADGNISNIIPGNCISVDAKTLLAIKNRWLPLHNTEIQLPKSIQISSLEKLMDIKATAVYSDGSIAEKQVEWDCSKIDFTKQGTYNIKGKVVQDFFQFPLVKGYADPVILPFDNRYYYLATNDNVDDIGIFVRQADTKAQLFEPGFYESKILDVDEENQFIQTFWAPEFHLIGEELYIIFAVGPRKWGPQCHMMKLRKGGDIMKAEDWESPIRVKKKDGSYLAEDGITLDMTYFKAGGVSCLVWSYRKNIGTPLDSGSMLYIATTDERNPSVLISDPVLLSRPLYGWESIQGTINNEGPYPLVTNDMIYITYSGGAANGYTYALGLLSIPIGGDYLDANAWKKATTPVLSYYSLKDVYGPGHNSFFKDYNGDVMILYHGEVKLAQMGIRCTGMHRVHFNKLGIPVFHVSGDRDLNSSLTNVSIAVSIG
ncbi:MAG TPA: family 43 glycosylhydrolase [Lachnospiraceae bacterium]|nr:family 43 glycosylhydrolase [Lachnospiraceae bacterium]